MIGKMNIQALIDKAIQLSDTDEHRDLNTLFWDVATELGKGKNLIERRNTAVHGVFSSSPVRSEIMVERHKIESERDRRLYPVAELTSISDDLYNLIKRIADAFDSKGINVH